MKIKQQFQEIIQKEAYHLNAQNFQIERCTGNFLERCKDCENSFFIQECDTCINFIRGLGSKDNVDCTGMLECERCYQVGQCSRCYNLQYSSYCSNCKDSAYLDNCLDCSYCFGCIGLKRKHYCIFNKQYTKAEYEGIIPRLRKKIES
ncbi:hypothetical protein KKH82_04695, partial [Patescibacteria group bacterium]|nr:hypothetical protein [Patescibacteria group bacterium]